MAVALRETIKHTIDRCTIDEIIHTIPQALLVHMNQTIHQVSQDIEVSPFRDELKTIYTRVIQDLRSEIRPMISLSTNLLKLNTKEAVNVAYLHSFGHVVTHGIHHLESIHFLHEMKHIFSLIPMISLFVPVIGLVATYYEHRVEHALHSVAQHYKKFAGLPEAVLEFVLNYLTSYAMQCVMFNLQQQPNPQTLSTFLVKTVNSAFVFTYNYQGLERCLSAWRDSISIIFQSKGYRMANQRLENQFLFERGQLEVAFEVQELLNRTDRTFNPNFLKIPTIPQYFDELHQLIVEQVLAPFEWRATGFKSSAWFCGYSGEMFDLLRLHHSRLSQALSITYNRLADLPKDQESFQLQIMIINQCLLTALHQFGKTFHWHPAAKLIIQLIERYPNFRFNKTPLIPSEQSEQHFIVQFNDALIFRLRQELQELQSRFQELTRASQNLNNQGLFAVRAANQAQTAPIVEQARRA